MKIMIATLYGAQNVGAFLQAFSLQTVVESVAGVGSCSFIRFSGQVAEHGSKLKKVAGYLKKGKLGHLVFKYRTAKKYRSVATVLHIDRQAFSADREYDTVVIGSDEVWNCASNSFVHHKQYFAKDIQAKKVIAYAPSAGNTRAETIRDNGVDFTGFRYLSARDGNACEIVREIDGREPCIVCDPTLLIDSFAPYLQPIQSKHRKSYILVYSYGLSKETVTQVKKFARHNKKRLISVGTYNVWCDENIVVNPFEFLSWLQCADLVITSTFHGAVLSVKLHKQMAVYAGNNYKINYFLQQMGLENRNASSETLDGIFSSQIDYEEIERKIECIRTLSMDYLKGALESHEN